MQRKYIKLVMVAGLTLMVWGLAGCGSAGEADQMKEDATEIVAQATTGSHTETVKETSEAILTETQSGETQPAPPDKEGTGPALKEEGTSSWYDEILADSQLTYEYGEETYALGDYDYYALIDLAGDGNPELILSTTEDAFFSMDNKAIMLGQVDGEVRILGVYENGGGCSLYYNEKEGKLGWYTRLSGQSNSFVYILEDGALKEVESLDSYQPFHDPGTEGLNKEDKYYINGLDVSKEDFQKEYNKYFSDDDVLTYVAINR